MQRVSRIMLASQPTSQLLCQTCACFALGYTGINSPELIAQQSVASITLSGNQEGFVIKNKSPHTHTHATELSLSQLVTQLMNISSGLFNNDPIIVHNDINSLLIDLFLQEHSGQLGTLCSWSLGCQESLRFGPDVPSTNHLVQ